MRYLTRADFREAQKIAVPFIKANPKCGIFADVGLGKCGMAIVALSELFYELKFNRILVVAPKNVTKITWPEALQEWSQEHTFTYEMLWGAKPGTEAGCKNGQRRVNFWKKKVVACQKEYDTATSPEVDDLMVKATKRINKARKALVAAKRTLKWGLCAVYRPADVHLINRDNIFWMVSFWGKYWPYDAVVYDESSDLKNGKKVQRWRAMRMVMRYVTYFIELTGSPTPKGLIDLWGQVYLLDKGKRLGDSMTEFRETYFTDKSHSEDYSNYKPQRGALTRITEAIQDICLTLESKDFMDLPPTIYNHIPIVLSDEEMRIYREFETKYVVEFENTLRDAQIKKREDMLDFSELESENVALEALSSSGLQMKLLQLANGMVYDRQRKEHTFHTNKLDAVADYINEQAGHNILLSYFFQHDLKTLKKRFPKAPVFDMKIKDAWNAGDIPLMLVHPQSAGHGINIQFGGRRILHYGPIPTRDLELWLQLNGRLADARAVGLGTTFIDTLVARDTIDEIAVASLESKDASQKLFRTALKTLIHKRGASLGSS